MFPWRALRKATKRESFLNWLLFLFLVTDHHKNSDLFGKTLLWIYAALEYIFYINDLLPFYCPCNVISSFILGAVHILRHRKWGEGGVPQTDDG